MIRHLARRSQSSAKDIQVIPLGNCWCTNKWWRNVTSTWPNFRGELGDGLHPWTHGFGDCWLFSSEKRGRGKESRRPDNSPAPVCKEKSRKHQDEGGEEKGQVRFLGHTRQLNSVPAGFETAICPWQNHRLISITFYIQRSLLAYHMVPQAWIFKATSGDQDTDFLRLVLQGGSTSFLHGILRGNSHHDDTTTAWTCLTPKSRHIVYFVGLARYQAFSLSIAMVDSLDIFTHCYSLNDDSNYKQLDLYIPPGANRQTPLLVFIHGGAWRSEDKADHAVLAKGLANRGFPVATTNYR